MSVFLQLKTNEVKKTELIKNEERLTSVESNVISNEIRDLKSDLLYISDTINAHSSDLNNPNTLKELEKEYIALSDRKKIYDQIRFIDTDGFEKIRINYYSSGSESVDKANLQNKKDRYYFKDTISLKRNQIYISKMDLNVENGQVEKPLKPMIRLCTPLYNSENKLIGIVALNYYAKYLLDDFKSISSTGIGNFSLLDSNGYWLINSANTSAEWAFMYDDKKDISFKNKYPYEWHIINNSESGNFSTENGYFIYHDIIPAAMRTGVNFNNSSESIILGEGNWKVVSHLSENSKHSQLFFTSFFKNVAYIFKEKSFVFIPIFIISLFFAVIMTINKISKDRIKYFSEYDTMTGTFNRRAGYELLQKSYIAVINKKQRLSVCFIDVNGLKAVNDNLGHESGDELILTVVNEIKKHIGTSDYIIRLGGDEFLVVFINKSHLEAEDVWIKINDEYNKINKEGKRKYVVSASHGISEFKFDSMEPIDSIINSADEKMYNEKRIIKKNLRIIKS